MSYTKEEVQKFEAKDKRISKLAILKSLIEKLPLEVVYEVNKICELTDKYVDFVYNGAKPVVCSDEVTSSVKTSVKSDTIDWKKEAAYGSVPVPTPENIKILRLVMDEYKQTVIGKGVEINPAALLSTIYKARGKYPTKCSSVPLVLKLI